MSEKRAVLISIKPKYCELIALGKKTVEVRKTKPKLETPFKCYIYECRDLSYEDVGVVDPDAPIKNFVHHPGKIIGEFICQDIFSVWPGYIGGDCLTFSEQERYLGANGHGWGWAISNLVVYSVPIDLKTDNFILSRAPQSWCYVEKELNV